MCNIFQCHLIAPDVTYMFQCSHVKFDKQFGGATKTISEEFEKR